MPKPYDRSGTVFEALAGQIEDYMTLEDLSNEGMTRLLVRMSVELTFAGMPAARPGFIANMEKNIIALLEGTAEGLR